MVSFKSEEGFHNFFSDFHLTKKIAIPEIRGTHPKDKFIFKFLELKSSILGEFPVKNMGIFLRFPCLL